MPQPLATEPRDLLLDDDNDLVIDSDLNFVRGIDGVVQACRIALQMFRGEWFLNLDAGIPYWDQILGQKPAVAIAIARDAFRAELLDVDGVLDIIRLDVEYNRTTRAMSVTWQVSTALGETPVDIIGVDPFGET